MMYFYLNLDQNLGISKSQCLWKFCLGAKNVQDWSWSCLGKKTHLAHKEDFKPNLGLNFDVLGSQDSS